VNKDESVVIVADHGGSTTNADIKEVKFEVSSIYSVPPELFITFKNLEVLNMMGQKVQDIKSKTFKNAHYLRHLDLAYNLLEKVDQHIFSGVNNIKILKLTDNKIEEVDKDSFKKLLLLEEIWLNNNFIKYFDPTTLETLTELRMFTIYGSPLGSLHKTTFKNNLKLEKLYLGINKFGALSNTMFSHLKNLDLLYLNHNNCINIRYEKDASSRMAEIENDLRNCGITYLGLENDEIIAKLNQLLALTTP
jgi:Leucine-rich repeat (LRR) protein